MLNSGKKIRALRDKKNKYSNSCVVRNNIGNQNIFLEKTITSRTLLATQSKPGLLADYKLSEVQMSYFYLCLFVCQYL
jgi:hypothetical protein